MNNDGELGYAHSCTNEKMPGSQMATGRMEKSERHRTMLD
jgi:hypothetical protein